MSHELLGIKARTTTSIKHPQPSNRPDEREHSRPVVVRVVGPIQPVRLKDLRHLVVRGRHTTILPYLGPAQPATQRAELTRRVSEDRPG
jgi:hypothetical protein